MDELEPHLGGGHGRSLLETSWLDNCLVSIADARPLSRGGPGDEHPHPGNLRVLGTLRAADGTDTVRLEDRFDTDVDDLWSALTEPDRLARWLGAVDGDLRPGASSVLIHTTSLVIEDLAADLSQRERSSVRTPTRGEVLARRAA
ncbi:MAG: hypothetical protein HOQ45_03235 [Nocardioidaceae bacterium]|nr:hypothetical protein [Nocardioidaceae bacterium]